VNELWARITAIWDNLLPRERLLLSTVGILFASTLVFFAFVNPVLAASSRAQERVEAAERELAAMIRLRQEYESISARLTGVELRIRENQDKRNTLTLLETLASTSAVKIESMEERTSPDHELYRETQVEVELKNVTLTQAVSFLHSIEASARQFSVKGLRVKTRPDQTDLLDVRFTVSSFESI
jgi:type II secretory pathway component PulM